MNTKVKVLLDMLPKNGASVLTINKEMAQLMLERNIQNRSINRPKVELYKSDMNRGEWRMTGDTVKFDTNHNLIDGQKRLTALVESTLESTEFMICSGLDRNEVFTKIDVGQNRTSANTLEFIGVQNSAIVAAIIKNVTAFDKQVYGDRGAANRVMKKEEMIDFYHKNQEKVQNSAVIASSLYKKSGGVLIPSIMGSLHYLFSDKSEKQAYDFFEKLSIGINLESSSPILVLRNKILRSKANPKERLPQSELVKYIIIAWNKYRNNEPCKVLKLTDSPLVIM